MKKATYKISPKVWIYPSSVASWHFVTVPKKESAQIKKSFVGLTKGWGSLPVVVALGKSKWNTSIFPDSKSGTYILPLKAAIRKKEGIMADDVVKISFTIQA